MNKTIYVNGKQSDTAALIAMTFATNDDAVLSVIRQQMDDSWNHPKADQVTRRTGRAGRNDPCDCGSGKKWKKCCGSANPPGKSERGGE